jgi:signal transduction histidine kinase
MPGSIRAFEQPELFEERLSEFSARFVALPADQVDHELDEALLTLLEAVGLDRSSIAESSSDGQRFEITHSRTSPHAPAIPQGDLTMLWPWYLSELRRGRMLKFERLPDDLPLEATAERDYCTRVGMRSHLTFPFTVGDRVIGAMGFATFRREMHWSPRLVRSLRIVSEVIANAVGRKQAAHQEHRLRDQLAHSSRVNAMGEVVASIAHEVNQPLFAIVSNARAAGQLLGRKRPDLAEIGAALEDIVQDANRASAIIARVRSFLQRKPTELIPLSMNSVIETVEKFLGPELSRRRVTLSLGLSADLPSVLGDAVQLQQVLVNLLMNGAEAMESLVPALRRLEVRSRAELGEQVRIDVIDLGPGLGPETRARLFEPFFTTRPSGLGMGLAISRTIVEAHGGRIQALDTPGPGTTMQIWLPGRRA